MIKKSNLAFIFISAIVLFFAVRRLSNVGPGFLERISSTIMYPVLVVQQYLSKPVTKFFAHQKTVRELQHTIYGLKEDNASLLEELIQLHSVVWHMQHTQELIDFKQRYKNARVQLAQIIFKQCTQQEQYIFIDAGSAKGIAIDMVAIYKNCLVGRVSQVYPYWSRVTLVTDKTCQIAAYCATTQALGIHHGLNKSDETALDFVSHLDQLHPGDFVISSGEGLVFPQGFGLGIIHTCECDGLQYTVSVKPLIDVRNIDYCYIMQKS